jgi:hypothetical protein
LCVVWANPQHTLALTLSEWDLLVRQARCAGVLASLHYLLESENLLDQVPIQPRLHINSAHIHFSRFVLSLQQEIRYIQDALKTLDIPLVLLKGSAYSVIDNNVAQGRLFSDVDILVPEASLLAVETALIKSGWMTNTLDLYDQKYYRQWMHEIPPMRHLKRQTSIDVHHNILPKTSEFCPSADLLLANIVKVPEQNLWVLAPEDRVLHSATHLFHEGEWDHGFRDLVDLHNLLSSFAEKENFWTILLQRADQLKQQIPLYYALRYTHKILNTAIPQHILNASTQTLPNPIQRYWMDMLFLRALMPNHASCNDCWTGFARWLLFIRSHWLKMPLHLMIPHLLRKGLRRISGKESH